MLNLVFGGTFDPVHAGHLALARRASEQLDAEVRMLPSGQPPHRPPPRASAEHRLAMLELAIAGETRLRSDRRELDRAGPSWMVDTLASLRDELGAEASLALLLGADAFLGLASWHRWRELFGLAHLVVAARPGHAPDAPAEPLASALAGRWCKERDALHAAPAGRVLVLDFELHPVSATALREALARGEDVGDALPPQVRDYIARHRLYRSSDP